MSRLWARKTGIAQLLCCSHLQGWKEEQKTSSNPGHHSLTFVAKISSDLGLSMHHLYELEEMS